MTIVEDKQLSAELEAVAKALDDALGEDLVALEVGQQFPFADVFLVATADNPRHMRSLVDVVQRAAKESTGVQPRAVEGDQEAGWIVVDYGGLVVHLFLAEDREYYALEKLWGEAPRIELDLPQRASAA